MRLMILAAISLLSIGCGSVPKMKQTDLYIHDKPYERALCTRLGEGTTCPQVKIQDTDRWFMFTPEGMKNLLDYIDLLVLELRNKKTLYGTDDAGYKLREKDLLNIKAQIQSSVKELNGRL